MLQQSLNSLAISFRNSLALEKMGSKKYRIQYHNIYLFPLSKNYYFRASINQKDKYHGRKRENKQGINISHWSWSRNDFIQSNL